MRQGTAACLACPACTRTRCRATREDGRRRRRRWGKVRPLVWPALHARVPAVGHEGRRQAAWTTMRQGTAACLACPAYRRTGRPRDHSGARCVFRRCGSPIPNDVDRRFRGCGSPGPGAVARSSERSDDALSVPSLLCRNGSYYRPPGRRGRRNVLSVARAVSGPVTRVGSEPDVGVGRTRRGYPRETQRPGWAGRCGCRRQIGKCVASSDHPSAAEGSSGARGDGGDGRCPLLRQTSLEAVLSRARTTSGWALTLAARESSDCLFSIWPMGLGDGPFPSSTL